ncbi:MAG: hypothetical protein PVI07_17860 [Anaerolineae bacterium]|jgi:hypothetical protein
MASRADGNERKFAEPRSWAGKWCGHGLNGGKTQSRDVKRKEGRFSEPRGWSARWCGKGLFKGGER